MQHKKCQFCGEDVKIEALKCKHCNEWLDGSHKEVGVGYHRFSGKTSTTKFIVLSFATFGLYPFFWSYDQWCLLREKENSKIWPFWRAVFGILWTYSLASDLKSW